MIRSTLCQQAKFVPVIILVLSASLASAQTPEMFIVTSEKADLYDGDGNVVAQANRGDVFEVLVGSKRGWLAGGAPNGAREIDSKHLVYGTGAEGLKILEELIAAGSKNPDHYHLRADSRSYTDDLEGKVADLTKAIELAPQDARGYQSRSEIYLRQKEYDKAIADLQQVVKLDPQMRNHSMATIGRIYATQENWEPSIETFSELLEGEDVRKYSRAEYLTERAKAYEALQKWGKAKADYLDALELNPHSRPAAAGIERLKEQSRD